MSEKEQADQFVELWVSKRVLPKVLLLISADDDHRNDVIRGMYDIVRLLRLPSGNVQVSCSNERIVEVLTRLLGEKYLVRHTHQSEKYHIMYIAPKSEQA